MESKKISELIQNHQIVKVPGVSDFALLHSQGQCCPEMAPELVLIHLSI